MSAPQARPGRRVDLVEVALFAVLVVAASALALAGGLAAGLLEDRGRCARGGGHVEAKNCRDELSADPPSVTVTCDRVCVDAKAEDERPFGR